MSWSYSGTPGSSALDEVRFLITDTVETKSYTLQDEEINYAITLYSASPPVIGQNFYAAAVCADIILGRLKGVSASKSVGDLSVDFGAGFKFFDSLAMKLRQRANLQRVTVYCGGLSLSEKAGQNALPDRPQPAFKIDGMNEPSRPDDSDLIP